MYKQLKFCGQSLVDGLWNTEDAAFKVTDNVLKSINQKCMLGEFSVI
jgi:hypothetical protein